MPRLPDLFAASWTVLTRSDLARSSVIVLLIRALNVFCAIGISIVLIRSLGARAYGFYAVYMSTFTLVALPLTSGMPYFIVKEVAPRFAERNGNEIKGVMRFFLQGTAIYMGLVALVLIAAWYLQIGREYRPFGILLWFHVSVQILNAGRSALLRAIGRVVKGQLADRLIQPAVTFVLTIAGWMALGSHFDVFDALVALLLSAVLSLALGAYWIREELGEILSEAVPSKRHREWLSTLASLSGIGLLNTSFTNGVILIVGSVGSLEAAALYRLASAVAVVLNYLQEAMIQVVAPRIAELWHAGDKKALARLLMVGAVTNSGAIGIGTIILALVGGEILALAYGAEYRQAYWALLVLSCGNLAYALGGYRDLLLNMSGHAKEAFKISAVLVPVGLLAAAAGVFVLAQTGGALAVLLFQIAASLWLASATRKLTGIDPSILGLIRNPIKQYDATRPAA